MSHEGHDACLGVDGDYTACHGCSEEFLRSQLTVLGVLVSETKRLAMAIMDLVPEDDYTKLLTAPPDTLLKIQYNLASLIALYQVYE
jgi:hypothetical protein